MKIFLIGLPGSGKSTIGRELSQILNLPLIDTDDEICKKKGTSIEEIFRLYGENYFREYERKVLLELIHQNDSVISTGGGLPCFFDNMEVINLHGTSIFLDVPSEAITERLWSTENQNRPMIKGKTRQDLFEFIESKYKERLPFYSKASIVLKGEKITGNAILEQLKKAGLIK